MLNCILIFTIIAMLVKRDIWKTIVHKQPICYEHMCLCWVYTLIGMIWCCSFSKCNKNSTTRPRCLYVTFYLRCKCSTFLGARLMAMQWSKEIWYLIFIVAERRYIPFIPSNFPIMYKSIVRASFILDIKKCYS